MMMYEMFDDDEKDIEVTPENLAKMMLDIMHDNPNLFKILVSLLNAAAEARIHIDKIYEHLGVENDTNS